jgi:hypothetical protein
MGLAGFSAGSPPVSGSTGPSFCPKSNNCANTAKLLEQEKDKTAAAQIVAAETIERYDQLLAATNGAPAITAAKRDKETIVKLQLLDLVQRRQVDHLEEENAVLRRVMRTAKMDMEAVDAIVAEAFAGRTP